MGGTKWIFGTDSGIDGIDSGIKESIVSEVDTDAASIGKRNLGQVRINPLPCRLVRGDGYHALRQLKWKGVMRLGKPDKDASVE